MPRPIFCTFVCIVLLYFIKCNNAVESNNSDLHSLSIEELRELIEVRNLDPCLTCSTRQDYLYYLSHYQTYPLNSKKEMVSEEKSEDVVVKREKVDSPQSESIGDDENVITDEAVSLNSNKNEHPSEEFESFTNSLNEEFQQFEIQFEKDVEVIVGEDEEETEQRRRSRKAEIEEMLMKNIDFGNLEEVMREEYQKLWKKKMKEDEVKLIKGLIHIFAESILILPCLVGLYFILAEMKLFFKSTLIGFFYFALFASIACASLLGIVKYAHSIIYVLYDWQEQHTWIMESIMGKYPDLERIERWHFIVTSIASNILPLSLLAACRYTLGYSYKVITLVSILAIGLIYSQFNDYLNFFLHIIQYTNIIFIILTTLHSLFRSMKEYRPVATSFLFTCVILVLSVLILLFGSEFTYIRQLDERFHIEVVDIFHVLLSVAMIVIIMLSRVPALHIYESMHQRTKEKKEA